MKALITGASSGLGRDFAKILNGRGYDLVLVARDGERLANLRGELEKANPSTRIQIITTDLSVAENCKKLADCAKDIDLLINNAGFGDCGRFTQTDLDKELAMISTNITAYHILMKSCLKEMKGRGRGRILNVASIAGFTAGPLMATYYATKAYVVRLSEAVREELRREKSKVKISILCPGPVATDFSRRANVKFALKEADSYAVAKYAVKKMNKGKFYIVPTFGMKLLRFGAKLAPSGFVGRVVYGIQKRKIER